MWFLDLLWMLKVMGEAYFKTSMYDYFVGI